MLAQSAPRSAAPGLALVSAAPGTDTPLGACATVLEVAERAIAALDRARTAVPEWDSFRRATIEAGIAAQAAQLAQIRRRAEQLARSGPLPEAVRQTMAETAAAQLRVEATAEGTALSRAHRLFLGARAMLVEIDRLLDRQPRRRAV